MRVIATAGHVDHGKSTLVHALTGIDPDRLREEQQRQMTIDLGFAWMTLPDGEPVGIIDVPGHIDFIDNMLAGLGGIDATLLVIAADEGPMPQTLEHLAILELLRIQRGVVALTKTDLAPDAEWVEMVAADVRRLLARTPLAESDIVPVSARMGRGLPDLTRALSATLASAPPRRDLARPRLPVDRAFSLPGFGTVVTGTLVDGALAIGDEVAVLTQRGETLAARVRGLQTHKQKIECASPGSRVAINLTGVDVGQVARGSVVARPGVLRPTTLVDVRLELMTPVSSPVKSPARGRSRPALRNNAELKIFSGAAQSVARAWLLEGDALEPGQSGWAQLQFATPMVMVNGDRFIARLPSPSVTVGGGRVIDAHPSLRYRRRGGHAEERVLRRLHMLSDGAPADRVASALAELRFATREQALARSQVSEGDFDAAMDELLARDAVTTCDGVFGLADAWREVCARAADQLNSFHEAQPLQAGMPRESLRSRLGLEPRAFNAVMQMSGTVAAGNAVAPGVAIADEGDTVRLARHRVEFTPSQQRTINALLARCRAEPWATPSVKDARASVGDDVYEAMLRLKMLVQLGGDVILLPETYAAAVNDVRAFIQHEGQITAAQVRDAFGTTRKYALALMEHLDAAGVTRRVGDARVLR
jgi:selenocysteine-specific elongation factor